MPYDPNDPNQDSQNTGMPVDPSTGRPLNQPTSQMNGLNQLVKALGYTPTQQQLDQLNLQFKNGQVSPNDPSYMPLYLMAAAIGGTALAGAAGVGGGAGAGAAGNEGDAAALESLNGTPVGTGAALPSTQIGSGAITGAPSSVSSMAAPGAAAGLPDWLKTAGDVGQALGAAGVGAAQGRNADNNANIGFAQAQNSLYNSELAAPGKVAANSVRGDILSNAKDVSMAGLPSDIPVPTISGGLRPSMFSDQTRQTGRNITANAAATPLPVPTPPVLQPFENAGVGSDILNTAGIVGSLAKTIPPSLYPKIASWF